MDATDTHRLRGECEQFLYEEAERLDDRKLSDWLDLLTEDIEYRIPVRTTKERSSSEMFSDESFHMKDDYSSLQLRVQRLEHDFAWSEDPPSRTRRQVSNVRIEEVDAEQEELSLRNNLVVYQARDDQTDPEFLSAERHDRLRDTDAGWRLADRTVYLDHTIVPTDSLSIML